MLATVLLAIAPVALVAVAALIYWDANRVGVAYPLLWAAVVFWTATLGLSLVAFVPTVPVPGALVLSLIGPVLYLFERDEAKHGDEPADPHLLPNANAPGEDDGDERD